TVHRCEGPFLELSGGWYVKGTIATNLELQYQPANPPIPISHVEVLRVKASLVQSSAELR
ncbi:MAG: hypothetical protein H6Q89_4321, partial [Myxococcaceae bacterium]|nr:hypothetical protein [Myxococcaceae bacterium]